MGPCDDVRVAVQATLAWEGKGGHPRAQRGPVAGATTKFRRAPSIGVFGFVPVWARSIFSSSCVVVRAWCLVPVVRRRVRGTSGRSASAACGVRGVRAAQQRGSRQSYQSKRNASSIMLS